MRKLLLALCLAAAFAPEAFAQATSGRATTNAPTYANASTAPLSLQLDGDLRVAIEDAISAGITGTVAVTQSGTWDEVGINDSGNTITVDGTVTVTDGAGSLNVIVDSGALTATVTDGSGALNTIIDSGVLTTVSSVTAIANALPAGTNNIGDVDVLTLPVLGTTGGATPGKTLSAASTNATVIKASAGTLYSLTAINTTATIYYLKLYNVASGPTCNSDTVVHTIPIPASIAGAGVSNLIPTVGLNFTTGIAFCLTGALADNDNTNAATGVAINYGYK